MKSNTKLILTTMHVLFWVIFVGLCIETGAMLTSFFVSLFVNPEATRNLYMELKLSDLYRFGKGHYIGIVSLMIYISGLKAYIAYLVIKIFIKFNFDRPFDAKVSLLVSQISHIAMTTGILALIADGYSEWLIKRGVPLQQDWGGAEFLFLAGIIFIISEAFKKGVEFQSENELTI